MLANPGFALPHNNYFDRRFAHSLRGNRKYGYDYFRNAKASSF